MFSTIRDLINDPLGTLQYLALMIPCIVIALTVHEFFHAFTADRLGDRTPRSQGRVTLNPAAHIDIWGMVCLFLVGFGWGRPVQINERALRPKRWGSIAVSAAGPLSNLMMCFVGALGVTIMYQVLVRGFVGSSGVMYTFLTVLLQFFSMFMAINVNLFLFNLLPVPPLDGFHVVKMLFASPKNLSMWWKFERYGFIVLLLLVMLGVIGLVLGPVSSWIQNAILNGFMTVTSLVFGIGG